MNRIVASALALVLVAASASADVKALPHLRTVVLDGDAAPTEIGGVYTGINFGTSDDARRIAFSADIHGGSADHAIVLLENGAARVVARSGEETSGGAHFASFADLDLADRGDFL